MAILKQINLIQKSNNEDSLAATYNGCAESSFIDTGNIYEFIFQSAEILGSQGQQLILAVQLAHSSALLGAELTRFIMNHMVVKKQPCVSFKTDVTFDCEQYICGKSKSVSATEISNLTQGVNWEYGSLKLGQISCIENQIDFKNRTQIETNIANEEDFLLRSNGNTASCKIKSITNYTDISHLYCKNSHEYKENTIKLNKDDHSKYIEIQLSGITTPMYSNEPSSVSDYNLNMYLLRTYEFSHKSINSNGIDFFSGALNVASYINNYGIKGILGCSGDRAFLVATKDAKGTIGNNKSQKLEAICFVEKEISAGTFVINVNKSMTRSYFHVSNGDYYLPFAVNKLTKVDGDKSDEVYGGGDINSLFISSGSSIQLNEDNYKKETSSFTGVTDEEPEKAEEMASGINMDAALPIYDTNGNRVDTSSELYEGLRNFAARAKELGYILKMHEGEYYIVPNILIINVPSQDGKINTQSTWGDILKTYNVSKEAFCGANRINIYKFNEATKCVLGQVFRIPVSSPDKITITDEQLIGNYSGYNKIPNNLYIPAESGTETYESLSVDDRDQLDNIIREKDENGQETDKIKWSSFGRYLVRIGDCTLPISPQQIKVKNMSGSASVQTLRSRTAMKLKSGYAQEVVELSLTFVGAAQINGSPYQPYENDDMIYYRNGLRPLLSQFMKAPFLPIENELLNDEFSIFNVCLQSISIETMPGFPNGIQATLTLLPFDHTAFISGEEFFEGTFCWPLFRWYYQQKMIGDTYTKLDLFDITHHVSATNLTGEAGETKTIYFDPSKVLSISIPQESFLKQRKAAIYELYKKKAPNLYEDTSLNWKKLSDNEKDNVLLNYSHTQFISFQSFKNAHHKDDYPEFYDENGVFTLEKIAPIAEEMKSESFDNFQEWDVGKKIKMVCFLADFINCYLTTYQQSSMLGFIIKGLTKDLIKTSVDLMKKDMENLYYSGEEDETFYTQSADAIAPFKPTIEIYTANIDIIKYYQSLFIQVNDVDKIVTATATGGALAVAGGAALVFATSIVLSTPVGWALMIAGAIALGAAAVISFNDEDNSDWYNKIELQDFKEISDWQETINNYGGEIAIKINTEKSVEKYISAGTCQKSGEVYYMLPNALMEDMGGYVGTDAAKEEYKNYIENLQYLAHQTEQDIPFETYVLSEMYVEKAACTMTNSFAPLQTQMNSTPVYQYMGGSDVNLQIACKTKSRDNIGLLWSLVKKAEYLAREYKIAITSGIMKIDHPFLSLMGVKEVLLEDIDIETDRESAEGFNVSLTISSFDKTQKNREELNADGFGVAFQSVDDWKQYTRQKRAATGFDYGNVDFALKEAELYPDLELPTYSQVNQFLTKHPITDKYGVVFDRYENVTNCKYVDPDFYIRTEETLRDYIENTLLNAPENSAMSYDQYDNAYIESMPSNDEQMSMSDESGETKNGKSADGPNIEVNDNFKTNLEGSIDRMKELDQMALYGELPGSILYSLKKTPSVEDQNMSADDQAASNANWSAVKDIVESLIDNGTYTWEWTDETGRTRTTSIPGTTTLNVGQNLIDIMTSVLVSAEGTSKGQDHKEKQKALKNMKNYTKKLDKNAELSIRCYDQYDYLNKFDPNKLNDIKEIKISKCDGSSSDDYAAYRINKTIKGSSLSENSTYKREGTPGASLSAAFLGLYLLTFVLSQENMTDIDNLDLSQWYMIIDVEKPSNVFARYNFSDKNHFKEVYFKDKNEKKYPWHPCTFLRDLSKVGNSKYNNGEITFDDLLNGAEFGYRSIFEKAGVYLYKRGSESKQSTTATAKLKETFDPNGKTEGIDALLKENTKRKADVSAEMAQDELQIGTVVSELSKKISSDKNTSKNTKTIEIKKLKNKKTNSLNPDSTVKAEWILCNTVSGLTSLPNAHLLNSYLKVTTTVTSAPKPITTFEGIVINPDSKTVLEWNDTRKSRLAHLVYYFTTINKVKSPSFIVLNNKNMSVLWSKEVNDFFDKHNKAVAGKSTEDVTDKDKEKMYELFQSKGISIINSYKTTGTQTVNQEDAAAVAQKGEGSLSDLTNSIASMGLDNALEAANQNKLFRSAFADMMRYDHRGRLVRAFPSFHMFIVDEGEDNVFWSMWDNFYGYNSLVSIDLYKDRRIIADTLKVQMTNIYHNLSSIDTELDYSKDKYSFVDIFSKDYWKDAVYTVLNLPDLDLLNLKQNKVNTMLLAPGARIHMRMGYGADAYNLPVVFNGTITECNTGELVEFIAQGDGVELTNKLHAKPKDTTDKSCLEMPMLPRQVIGNMMTSRGSFFSNLINDVTNNTFKKKNPLGIAHFGNDGEVPKITAWQQAPIFFGWWSRISSVETETNNFGQSLLNVYGGGPARSMTSWALTDLNSKSPDFSGKHLKSNWNPIADKSEKNVIPRARIYLYDMTVNDVCQMLAATCGDYVCAVVPFELRSTLFFGRPHWGCATEYINTYVYNLNYNQCEKRAAGYVRHSFSQARMYNSHTDILANDITTSTQTMKTNMIGYYNEKDGAKQTAVVQVDSDLDDDCQTTGIVHLPIKADWGIPTWLGYNYMHQGKYAEVAAISEMKSLMGTMYDGELIVIADPSAKPYDTVYLEDSYKDMAGSFSIRSVHHSMSIDGGFVSSITPDLISVYDDEQLITSINWRAQASSAAITLVGERLFTCVIWRKFLKGPVGNRIKQVGKQGAEYAYRKMLSFYSDDGAVTNLIDLVPDNLSADLATASSAEEAADIYNSFSKNAVEAVQDRYNVTSVVKEYGNLSDKELAELIKTDEFKGKLKAKGLKTVNVDDLDAETFGRYFMSDKDMTKFNNLNLGARELSGAEKELVSKTKVLQTQIDDFSNLTKDVSGSKIKLDKTKKKELKEAINNIKELSENANTSENLAKIEKILDGNGSVKIKVDDFQEGMKELSSLTSTTARKVESNVVDFSSPAAKKMAEELQGKLAQTCTTYNSKFLNSAVNKVDNLTDCIKQKKLLSTSYDKIKSIFPSKAAKEVAEEATEKVTKEAVEGAVETGVKKAAKEGIEKVAKEAVGEGVEKVAKEAVEEAVELGAKKATAQVLKKTCSKTLTASIKGLFGATCAAAGPIGWAVWLGKEIAMDMIMNTAFEAYCRWKRRRQALILMPMQYQHNTFVAGLDGHKGCILGDQPSKADTILMGETIWGVPFKVMNFLSGSDYDYSHQSLSQVYNDWSEEVNAWDSQVL